VKGPGATIGVALLAAGIVVLLAPLLVQAASGAPGVAVEEAGTYIGSGRAVIEEALTIGPGFAVAYCASPPGGAVLVAQVHVVSGGGVNVWVMDRGDWERFKRGEPFRYYTSPSRREAGESLVLWVPPPNREVCLVIDNTPSPVTPKHVRAKIELRSGAQAGGLEPSMAYERGLERPQPSRLSALGVVLASAGLGLIAGVARREAPT